MSRLPLIQKSFIFNMMLLFEQPDCHNMVRFPSGCESSESGVEAAVTFSHMLGVLRGILRNNFDLTEQTKALEILSFLKVKSAYQIGRVYKRMDWLLLCIGGTNCSFHKCLLVSTTCCHALGAQNVQRSQSTAIYLLQVMYSLRPQIKWQRMSLSFSSSVLWMWFLNASFHW